MYLTHYICIMPQKVDFQTVSEIKVVGARPLGIISVRCHQKPVESKN